jgi:DNA-directed RNA polymerase subunit beta'
VEVTRAAVRRERIGHIALATPVSHIWFLKSIPSRLSLALDVSAQKLERVIYYSAYIITDIKEENRKTALDDLDRELKGKLKTVGNKDKTVKGEIEDAADRASLAISLRRHPARKQSNRSCRNWI